MSEEKHYKYPWMAREEARKAEKLSKALKGLAPRTKKGQKEDRTYDKLATKYKNEHPMCEARLPCCTGFTTDIHHKKGRGIWLLIVEFFLGVCRPCHDWIEENPEEAIRLNLSVSRLTKK